MSTPVAARTVEIDDPGDLTSLLPADDAFLFSQNGEGLVAWGIHARIPVALPERFRTAEQNLRAHFNELDVRDDLQLPGTGPVALGAFTFAPEVAGSVLIIPRVIVGRRDGRAWRTVIGSADSDTRDSTQVPSTGTGDRTDRVRFQGSTMSEMAWLTAVDKAVGELRAGHAEKVVLARDRRVWSRTPFDHRRLVRHLADVYPECQTFWIDGLVGASPEVLVHRQGHEVRSLVLAGTAPRGDTPQADEAHATRLASTDKDLREHRYAVGSVSQALRTLDADIQIDEAPHILRLANVMHLATTVRARIQGEPSALALAGLLHPSAAVCGTPTEAAQNMIQRLEGMDRARYSGPVGWMDARGDGQYAIALRCAEINGARARLFAGAGIVDGSLPEAELEETRLKLRAMQSAFEA